MESGIREVEDNVEAAEAWNGPLYEIWIKYRDLVADGRMAGHEVTRRFYEIGTPEGLEETRRFLGGREAEA